MKKILLITLFMVVSLFGEHPKNKSDDESKNLIQISNNLTQVIQKSFSDAKAAVVTNELLLKQNNYDVSKFDSWAEELINEFSDVSNIQLAPNGVVTYIYPLAGNEKAIGHDLLKDPKRKIAAIEAMKSGKITLIGPIKLIQNNEYALIVRKPVDKDNEFWGFSTALVLVKDILKDITKVIDERNYNYTIYGNNPDNQNPTVLLNSEIQPSVDAKVFELIVPNSKWYLKIETKNRFQNNYLNLTKEELDYIKNKKEILVSNDTGFEPYDMLIDGKADGFSKEFLDLALANTGLKVKYVSKTWTELINDMDNKKIDVLKSVLKNNEREKKYLYTDSYLKSSDVYVTLNSMEKINSIEEMFGKTIAVGKNWAIDEFISKYPQIKKIYKDDVQELIEAVENEEAEFTIIDRFTAFYNINKHGHINLKVNNSLETNGYDGRYYFATSKDDKNLNSIINKAINKLSFKDKNSLLIKWFGKDSLTNKNHIEFTEDEIKYLKNKKVFNVCTRYNHMPLSGEKDGNITGISGDIFKRISQKLKIDFIAIEANSDKEFVENINSNKCELVTTISQDYQGFKKLKMTKTAIVNQKFVALGNINHFYIEELEEKDEFTFYVLKKIHKNKVKEIYPNMNVIQLNSEEEIFKKIQKDDNAFYITLSILGDYAIQKYGLDKFKVIDTIEDLSGKGAIGVNMVISPELLSIIDKTLQSIGSEALNDIAFEYKLKEFRIINSYTWLWYVVAILVAVVIIILGRYLFILKEANKEESIYREILDNSASKIAYVNKDYKYKKVNSNYALMLGKDKKNIENHYIFEVLGEEYFNKNLRENIDFALLGNNVEFEVVFKDRIISTNYSPYFDKETNSILGVIFNLVDVTEKREAELAEKELASRLKKSQEIGRLGAWKYLLKDNTFTLTGVVAKLHDVETLKAVSPEICFRKGHEEDIPKMAAALEGTLKDRNFKKELTYRIYDENNEIRYMEVKWEHIFDEGGNIIGLDGVGQDITEKMLSEMEIESQQAMLMHSQRLAQQGEMLQMIGHQWRQPLSQIAINAQIIEAFVENPSDIVIEKVQSIVDVTQFLSKTISDFKHFFTDKKQVVEFKVDEVFEDSLSVINHRITQQSINIHRNFIGLDEEIKGYKTELGQVVLAIVNNAIDVLEEKDQSRDINIEAFKDSDEVVIKIQDNAGGIPDDIINKIFDPYFSTKLEKNGTGLGLYMCKMIIEKSFEGTIEVENQNDGACFTIKFPPL